MKADIPAVLAHDGSTRNGGAAEAHDGHALLLVDSCNVVQQGVFILPAACAWKDSTTLIEFSYNLLSECAHALGRIGLIFFLPNV